MKPSMGSVGDAYDNAMADSFFATLEIVFDDAVVCESCAEKLN